MGFDFKSLSILVIEDSASMIKLVTSVIETMGVEEFYTAEEGKEGFEIFCKHRPDIIITDWDMKPMDGLEFINLVRNDPTSPNKMVPIIMMTGFSALPRVTTARDAGTTEFLVKPFSAKDLTNRIAHVITRPRDYVRTGNFFGPDRRRQKGNNSHYKRRAEDFS